VLDPYAVIDRFGADALRYYCFREVSFGQDGSVSAAGFETRYETELANEYGNLASRTIAMVRRYRDGTVPRIALDEALGADLDMADEVAEHMDRAGLTDALEVIWQRVRRLNRYVEERAPWTLAKDEARQAELDATLASLTEGVRVVSVLLHAFMPTATEKVLGALGEPGTDYECARYGAAEGGSGVGELEPLFPKR